MVSFVCDVCQDVVKKPKLENHKARCPQATFTCIDCNTHFEGDSYKTHTQCISEQQKYMGKLWPGNKKSKQNSSKGNVTTGSTHAAASSSASATQTASSTNESQISATMTLPSESRNDTVSNKRKRDNSENETKKESIVTKKMKHEESGAADMPSIASSSFSDHKSNEGSNPTANNNGEVETHVINIETLKWSKLIKRTLKKTEGRRMKLKTLQDVVVAEMLNRVRPFFERAFQQTLADNSKKFRCEGKYVTLV
jgi:cell growth-regulating nucleolar protein